MLAALLAAALAFTAEDASLAYSTAARLVAEHTPRDAGTRRAHLAADFLMDAASAAGADVRRDAFAAQTPKGDFRVAKGLLDRKVAGITRLAMLEARPGASDDDKIAIADENARRLKRFSEVAKKNGTSIETVQKRHVAKMREKLPAGIWCQDDSGKWAQKK